MPEDQEHGSSDGNGDEDGAAASKDAHDDGTLAPLLQKLKQDSKLPSKLLTFLQENDVDSGKQPTLMTVAQHLAFVKSAGLLRRKLKSVAPDLSLPNVIGFISESVFASIDSTHHVALSQLHKWLVSQRDFETLTDGQHQDDGDEAGSWAGETRDHHRPGGTGRE